MVCFGTRPEAIKLAPVISRLAADARAEVFTVVTGQHREMLDETLAVFGLRPDVDLDLMRPQQELADLTAAAVRSISSTIDRIGPDAVVVQGDTTTAMCAALAAAYRRVPVGHVEAGLRTGDIARPFPEEINRRLISVLGRWHWCPTRRAAEALLAENVPAERILVTGNTVIDALQAIVDRPLPAGKAQQLPARSAAIRILVTLHRRETQGETQLRLCRMLAEVAARPEVELLFPVHRSPAVRESVDAELRGLENVHLIEPLDYHAFIHALRSSDLVITDSGGVQEEAPVLGIPVLVMRDATERLEGVEAGCVRLSGTDPARVKADIDELLDDPKAYGRMARAANPYGDGHAAERIVAQLMGELVGGR